MPEIGQVDERLNGGGLRRERGSRAGAVYKSLTSCTLSSRTGTRPQQKYHHAIVVLLRAP